MTAKVELLTPSGGKVILDPTNTAVDRVLTLPAVAGTVLNTASDIEAQVKTATSATGSAPIFSCRAWVNFNGTGTVAIRASGNVSSITDNAVGNYTVNFTTAMPDTNYAISLFSNFSGGTGGIPVAHQTISFNNAQAAFRFQISDANSYAATRDQSFIYAAIFR